MTEDALTNYADVYDNRIGFGKKPALILVDFVQAYFDKSCELYSDVEDALASAIRIRDIARESSVLIVYTKVEYHKTAIDGGRFYEKARPLRHLVSGGALFG